jgi:hypothetical protein
MKKALAAMVAVLALPASASAYAPSASQRSAIENAAKRTHTCGYTGQFRELSDFRVATFGSAHFTVNIASVFWSPPEDDQCQIIFVNQPGYTLKSVATTSHPYLSWAPLTWGSSPFDQPSSLTTTWHSWFPDQKPPNWRTVARSLRP